MCQGDFSISRKLIVNPFMSINSFFLLIEIEFLYLGVI